MERQLQIGDLVKCSRLGVGLVIRGGVYTVQVKYASHDIPMWTSLEYLEKL